MEHSTFISDALAAESNINLATWNRPRSDEELRDFISNRHLRLAVLSDNE